MLGNSGRGTASKRRKRMAKKYLLTWRLIKFTELETFMTIARAEPLATGYPPYGFELFLINVSSIHDDKIILIINAWPSKLTGDLRLFSL